MGIVFFDMDTMLEHTVSGIKENTYNTYNIIIAFNSRMCLVTDSNVMFFFFLYSGNTDILQPPEGALTWLLITLHFLLQSLPVC